MIVTDPNSPFYGGPDPDPFVVEARRHRIRRLEHPQVREKIAVRIDDCDRCAELWNWWISVMMGMFIDGTGPFRSGGTS
jgi:hypothetical protein